MARIFGAAMTRDDILRRVGDISQICDARRKTYSDGRRAGVDLVDVKTGSGLAFTVLPSRGLDISAAAWGGAPFAWTSAAGEAAPSYFEPAGYGFLRGFFGGLLTTCGMTYSSHPCEDDGEELGLHGRVSNIPAEDVCVAKGWDGDEYGMTVSGRVREASVFGHNLELHRSISTALGSAKITVEDRITNLGFKESPLMMLYHVNIGWPFLSENSRLVSPTLALKPADDRSRAEIDLYDRFIAPEKGYAERVYFHDMKADGDGKVTVAVVNEVRERAVYLSYPKAEFPHFVQWKMMGMGEYVVGIEPGNITGHRADMRRAGTLEFIPPGAVRRFSLEIGILDCEERITECTEHIRETRHR